MTRSILTGFAIVAAGLAGASFMGAGCQSSGVGDPCTPEQEYDSTFAGFVEQEVSTEGESFQCQTRLCLVNHFQGRVSCPYGQTADAGLNPPATNPCLTPGFPAEVTGPLAATSTAMNPVPVDPSVGFAVQPQCVNRQANQTVYCSCRCEDINGNTQGGNFCKCPDGFTCTQLVSSLSAMSDQGLTGGYCIKNGTAYDNTQACQNCGGTAAGANCGSPQNNGNGS